MRADHAILALLFATLPARALAQPANAGLQTGAPPVITCTSLANLRSVLRTVKDDSAAAVPIITDPKSDLGCSVLDRGAVTGIADHVALNGRAYDCLVLQGTSVCHWTVAGSVTPPASGTTGKTPSADKGRR